MKKIDEIIDGIIFWIYIGVFTAVLVGANIFLVFILWDTYKPLIIFPAMMFLTLRKIYWRYIKGLLTLNSDDFPRCPLWR